MTLIDRAEALAEIERSWMNGYTTRDRLLTAIAALAARGVGVKALDDLERFSAREIAEFAEKYEAEDAERWLDYRHVYDALAPTDAAQADDCYPYDGPEQCERDLEDTAAQARETALQDAAEVAKSWYRQWAMYSDDNEPTRDDRAGGITYGRLQGAETIAAGILALIGEKRDD